MFANDIPYRIGPLFCCVVILRVVHEALQRYEQFPYEFVAKRDVPVERHVRHVRCDSEVEVLLIVLKPHTFDVSRFIPNELIHCENQREDSRRRCQVLPNSV